MPTLLIASTTPRAGKTALAALIASRLLEHGGREVTLTKAGASDGDPDAAIFRKLLPGAAAGEPADGSALNIVEGSSGDTDANRRLAEEIDARILLVAALGDSIVETAEAYGDRLAGVIVNTLPQYRRHTLETGLIPALEAANIPYLGAIPEDRRLVASTVRQISEHLEGAFSAWEEHADELADHVLLGGMVLDWGVHYFSSKENAVVMVRGDRPDIQMAALATPIKGLILTQGIEPLEHVYYTADQEEVPITVVPANTHEAAAALESLLDTVRFDHPAKLTRLQELAESALDFDAIEEALAQPVTG